MNIEFILYMYIYTTLINSYLFIILFMKISNIYRLIKIKINSSKNKFNAFINKNY